MGEVPRSANVVIIGAGIVGCSVAYHLALKGIRDVVLLEKDTFPGPGGSTNHASDFIYPIDHNRQMTQLTVYSIEQYEQFSRYIRSGGLEVARTDERMVELQRKVASGKSWGVEAYMISPSETKELFPFVDETTIKGAMYAPSAGLVTRSRYVAADMVEKAESMGSLQMFNNTPVTGIDVKDGRVKGVRTSKGAIRCDTVICAVGVWGPLIGAMAGVSIPLVPVHHPLMYFDSAKELGHVQERIEYPLFRDQDVSAYVRHEWDKFEWGYYERYNPRVVRPQDILERDEVRVGMSPTMEPLELEHIADNYEEICETVPILATIEWNEEASYNGLLSFTPDGMPILGESPEVKGFWLGEAVWVKDGPGVGKLLADWIVDGETDIDTQSLDIARFHPHAKTERYVEERSTETARKVYGIIHPREQYVSGRNMRRTPFYDREVAAGAEFIYVGGWERVHWYESNAYLLEEFKDRLPERTNEWDARWWSPIINAEHLALRERGAMFDLSSFSKFDVRGSGALDYMQKLTVANMDVAVGRAVYTQFLNTRGGLIADVTIQRLGEEHFRLVTGPGTAGMDKKHMVDQLPDDGSVHIHEVTSSLAVIGLWGPRALDVVQPLTDTDMSVDAFPFATVQDVVINGTRVTALRISYVGESGWELYVPTEETLNLWDTLREAGEPHGVILAGVGVYSSTARMEKGYRNQGDELTIEYNMFEAGMARPRVKRQHFIGKEAYMKQREEEPAALLCTLTVDDHISSTGEARYMTGKEPILDADGEPIVDAKGRVSYVTSAGDGPSVGKFLLMAYLPPEYAQVGTSLQVEYVGERYPVTVEVVGSTPLFDPENERMR